jgi:hypothetical protein
MTHGERPFEILTVARSAWRRASVWRDWSLSECLSEVLISTIVSSSIFLSLNHAARSLSRVRLSSLYLSVDCDASSRTDWSFSCKALYSSCVNEQGENTESKMRNILHVLQFGLLAMPYICHEMHSKSPKRTRSLGWSPGIVVRGCEQGVLRQLSKPNFI